MSRDDRWEYLDLVLPAEATAEDELGARGAQGWELCGMTAYTDLYEGRPKVRYTLKRMMETREP